LQAALLGAAAVLTIGCAAWDSPPPAETMSEESRTMSSMRQAGPEGQIMGVDERARQIERNLGIR